MGGQYRGIAHACLWKKTSTFYKEDQAMNYKDSQAQEGRIPANLIPPPPTIPQPLPKTEVSPLDRVKLPTEKKRSRERER